MPNPFFADLVRELCQEGGTGPLTPTGAVPGHRRFADIVPADTMFHYAVSGIGQPGQWEAGLGHIDASGRLVRDTVAASSAGGERVGTHRSVWIDRDGRLTTHPRRHSQTVADSVMAALTALTLLGLLHTAARTLVDRRLERRRLDLWEREWAAVAPRWTGLP